MSTFFKTSIRSIRRSPQRLADSVAGRVIAIDGKTLRHAYEKDRSPLHLVSAFVAENRLVLGQQAVADKSNEITAIPQVIRLLDVKKAIVTIDAMGCQKDIAATIKEGGADYVLGLKENQPTLYQEAQALFMEGLATDFKGMKYEECTTQEKDHGRVETRTYYQIQPSKAWLKARAEWKGLKTLGMVVSERQVGDGEVTRAIAPPKSNQIGSMSYIN